MTRVQKVGMVSRGLSRPPWGPPWSRRGQRRRDRLSMPGKSKDSRVGGSWRLRRRRVGRPRRVGSELCFAVCERRPKVANGFLGPDRDAEHRQRRPDRAARLSNPVREPGRETSCPESVYVTPRDARTPRNERTQECTVGPLQFLEFFERHVKKGQKRPFPTFSHTELISHIKIKKLF